MVSSHKLRSTATSSGTISSLNKTSVATMKSNAGRSRPREAISAWVSGKGCRQSYWATLRTPALAAASWGACKIHHFEYKILFLFLIHNFSFLIHNSSFYSHWRRRLCGAARGRGARSRSGRRRRRSTRSTARGGRCPRRGLARMRPACLAPHGREGARCTGTCECFQKESGGGGAQAVPRCGGHISNPKQP